MIKELYTRYFFIGMAVLFIIFAVAGFIPDYQLMHKQHIAIFWFAHVHGVIMTAWLLVYLIQATLIRRGNFALHRKIGLASVGLGAMVWLSMGIVIYHSNIGYPRFEHVAWANVILLSMFMNLFAVFLAWGILARKNSAVHKRLIFVATMIAISAGYNRILFNAGVQPSLPWLAHVSHSGLPNPSGILLYHDLLLILLFIYDLMLLRSVHRITWIATVIIIAVQLSIVLAWPLLS